MSSGWKSQPEEYYRVVSACDPGYAILVKTHASAILVYIRNTNSIESIELLGCVEERFLSNL